MGRGEDFWSMAVLGIVVSGKYPTNPTDNPQTTANQIAIFADELALKYYERFGEDKR